MFLSLLSCVARDATANQVCLQETCYNVEIAIKPEDQSLGLMYRPRMPEDHGMLFVFPESRRHSFWMRNTKIPLDIIWLDHARRVVHIEKAEPCTADPCRHYVPEAEALYVLELNAGQTDKTSITIGDQMEFKLDLNDL